MRGFLLVSTLVTARHEAIPDSAPWWEGLQKVMVTASHPELPAILGTKVGAVALGEGRMGQELQDWNLPGLFRASG